MEKDLVRMISQVQTQYVTVTFNSTANNDTIIRHNLKPPTPDDIDYEVVRVSFSSAPATVPVIYYDSGSSRRKWEDGYIVLRANVASLSAELKLTVRR